jgi:hypothetical protein
MAALRAYTGENSDAEHAADAKHLGGADAYRMRLANALLDTMEGEAMFAACQRSRWGAPTGRQ